MIVPRDKDDHYSTPGWRDKPPDPDEDFSWARFWGIIFVFILIVLFFTNH